MYLKWHGRLVCTESPYRFLASNSVQSYGDEYVEYHLKICYLQKGTLFLESDCEYLPYTLHSIFYCMVIIPSLGR